MERCDYKQITKEGFGMKKLIVSLGIVLLGIVFFTAPCYAACPFPEYGPYATVKKYATGKTKVVEIWECIDFISSMTGNTICFYNYVNNSYDYQFICFSGEFKIELPLNADPSDFFY